MGNFYSETYTYRDGRILLYKRPNSKNFQCRLRVEGIKGYIILSCQTPNLGKALKFAEDTYDNMRFKKINNLPLKTKTFRQIYNEWFSRAEKSEYRKDFYTSRARLYFFPYFGDYNIEEITESVIDDYWVWRKNYYKNNPEKYNRNAAMVPSALSLRMEKTAIKEILEYAQCRGYIRTVPAIRFKPRCKPERRETFTPSEYRRLVAGLAMSAQRNAKKNDIYQRKMLYNLVVFLANTGIRPNEFYKIKWQDISVHIQGKIKILYISISEDNKTGKRTVVSLPEAYSCYENVKSFSLFTKPTDYFFTNYDGSWVKNISKSYVTAARMLKLYMSSDGKPRPLYSLRHYYATQRLMDGVQVFDLARNMGTSVKQIEQHYGHVLSTQKSEELIQGASKSNYQQREELEDLLGVNITPEHDSFVLGETEEPQEEEDQTAKIYEQLDKLAQTPAGKKKLQEFMLTMLKNIGK